MSTADKALQITDAEVLKLSRWRLYFNRVPDILVNFRKKMERENAVWSEADRRWYSQQFLAYCREHEDCDAPLTITNVEDDEPGPWLEFCWTNEYVLTSASIGGNDQDPPGCECDDDECDPATCKCVDRQHNLDPSTWPKDRRTFAYDQNGLLSPSIFPNTVIYECNDSCGCAATCRNRNVQHGRRVGVDLFKTKARGWGLKATQNVPKGEFVMVYTGELLDIIDAEKRGRAYDQHGIGYLLDLDSWHIKVHCMYKPYNDSRKEKKLQPLDIHGDEISTACSKWFEKANSPTLTVDAGLWGNLSRYLNHSCDPNLTMYPVYYGKRAGYIPQPDIKAGEELTFSYNGEDENNLDDDFDDEEMEEDSEDEDEQRAWAEGVSSQKPGTSAPKGFKTQKQRRKARKVVSASQDEDAKQSELGNLKAQVCRCGAKNCKKYFWS
ncbi:hypothetical protein OC845_001138 [Tilletia horrida]|nr:hypothetical protein OC845_001138 [Tilletia horrida]